MYTSVVTLPAKDGRALATDLCNTSGQKTQHFRVVAWLHIHSTHLGCRMGMHSVSFSQKEVISPKTSNVSLHALDLPCTQAQLICSVSLQVSRSGQLSTRCCYHLMALRGNLLASVQPGVCAGLLPSQTLKQVIVVFSLKMPFCSLPHQSCRIK